jgi:transposase
MEQIYGIDLSKKKLDVGFIDKNGNKHDKTIDNNLSKITRFLKQLPANSALCAEYTGTPGNLLRFLAHVNSIPIIMVTGYEVKHSLGLQKGKSDKADAHRIREYAERFYDKLNYAVYEGECLFELQELHTLRDQLVKQRKMLATQKVGKKSNPYNSTIANKIEVDHISSLDSSIKLLEEEMVSIMKTSPELNENLELVTSIKGIGLITASDLIIKTRNFSRITTAKKAASYAGVCPFPNASGQMVKKSKVSPMADRALKSLLYMCSSSAVQHNKEMKLYYQRKMMEGKPHFLIMNNVANKLLRTIYSIIESRIPWNPNYICLDPRIPEKMLV